VPHFTVPRGAAGGDDGGDGGDAVGFCAPHPIANATTTILIAYQRISRAV
jgi:hypothetical protein